jgi:hypothetical protein
MADIVRIDSNQIISQSELHASNEAERLSRYAHAFDRVSALLSVILARPRSPLLIGSDHNIEPQPFYPQRQAPHTHAQQHFDLIGWLTYWFPMATAKSGETLGSTRPCIAAIGEGQVAELQHPTSHLVEGRLAPL